MKSKDDIKKLGEFIKEQRIAHGYSISKLAKLSKVSAGLICQIENAKKTSMPKIPTLLAIASVFNISDIKFLTLAGYLDNSEKELHIEDFRGSIRSVLAQNGFENTYIQEIINYIDTVKIKQDLKNQTMLK